MKTSTTGLRFPKVRALRWDLPIAVLVGWLFGMVSTAQTYEIVHAFRNSGQPGSLVRANDGHLYGTTCWGGAHGVGSVFRVDANGISEIYSFGPLGPYPEAPCSTLMQASSGDFYGTSIRGGDTGFGAAFRIDQMGNFVLLHSFTETEGAWPSGPLLESSDGYFYGTASLPYVGLNGVLFKMDASGTVVVLHTFAGGSEGARPSGALAWTADGIFGTTFEGGPNGKGTVFKLDSANTLTTVHSFEGSDGSAPKNGLIRASGGNLFGTTSSGGAYGFGTIFKIDNLGIFATLHSFDGTDGTEPVGLVPGTDGNFYGTTAKGGAHGLGTTFRMTPSGEITTLHSFNGADGSQPVAQLVLGDGGVIDGIARFGGTGGVGVVFETDEAGNIVTVASFENLGEESLGEVSRFVQGTDGALYATSSGGGDQGAGTIFRLDGSGKPAVLHSFVSSEGSGPFSTLIQGSDGALYGTAQNGGEHGMGTIVKFVTPDTLTVLHSFSGDDGGYPAAALIQGADGDFYGTTSGGGQFGAGTVFRMNGSGEVLTLHDFATPDPEFPDGENPMGSLTQLSNGFLYGTTMNGGDSFLGTIFDAVTSGGAATVHSFDSNMGSNPISGLTEGSDGKLYGTTPYVWGTVFRFDPAGGGFETLHVFGYSDENDGHEPHDGVIEGSDGAFYGTTFMGGDLLQGTIFRMDSSGNVTRVHSFNRFDGANPLVGVIQASDGDLYGAAFGGPLGGQNIIFRVSNAVIALNQIAPTSGTASGGTTIDLIGGGFAPGAAVTVGGVDGVDVQTPDPTFVYLRTPALSPGTLNDVSIASPGSISVTATRPAAFFADFLDVPQNYLFHDYVEKIFRAGITAGCGGGSYCPDDAVTRAQMAVFLLKAEHGPTYVPPPCGGRFADVTCPSQFANWIEQLAAEGITAGCGGSNYCPNDAVTRAQMAVFLLKAEHGSSYAPPACTGVFGDVDCPSLFANFIEQLAAEGITGGCGGGNYCPSDPNTRGQMAVFLVKTFQF